MNPTTEFTAEITNPWIQSQKFVLEEASADRADSTDLRGGQGARREGERRVVGPDRGIGGHGVDADQGAEGEPTVGATDEIGPGRVRSDAGDVADGAVGDASAAAFTEIGTAGAVFRPDGLGFAVRSQVVTQSMWTFQEQVY